MIPTPSSIKTFYPIYWLLLTLLCLPLILCDNSTTIDKSKEHEHKDKEKEIEMEKKLLREHHMEREKERELAREKEREKLLALVEAKQKLAPLTLASTSVEKPIGSDVTKTVSVSSEIVAVAEASKTTTPAAGEAANTVANAAATQPTTPPTTPATSTAATPATSTAVNPTTNATTITTPVNSTENSTDNTTIDGIVNRTITGYFSGYIKGFINGTIIGWVDGTLTDHEPVNATANETANKAANETNTTGNSTVNTTVEGTNTTNTTNTTNSTNSTNITTNTTENSTLNTTENTTLSTTNLTAVNLTILAPFSNLTEVTANETNITQSSETLAMLATNDPNIITDVNGTIISEPVLEPLNDAILAGETPVTATTTTTATTTLPSIPPTGQSAPRAGMKSAALLPATNLPNIHITPPPIHHKPIARSQSTILADIRLGLYELLTILNITLHDVPPEQGRNEELNNIYLMVTNAITMLHTEFNITNITSFTLIVQEIELMESKNNSEAHKAFKDVHFAQEYLSALTSALAMKKKLEKELGLALKTPNATIPHPNMTETEALVFVKEILEQCRSVTQRLMTLTMIPATKQLSDKEKLIYETYLKQSLNVASSKLSWSKKLLKGQGLAKEIKELEKDQKEIRDAIVANMKILTSKEVKIVKKKGGIKLG